jgi:hypothetical protein
MLSPTPGELETYLGLPYDRRRKHPLDSVLRQAPDADVLEWLLPYLRSQRLGAIRAVSQHIADRVVLAQALDIALSVSDASTVHYWLVELSKPLGFRRLVSLIIRRGVPGRVPGWAVVYHLKGIVPPDQTAAWDMIRELEKNAEPPPNRDDERLQ